ncbi:MAG: HPr family phosphocarrier protein [Candidatus Glassbacteria bacterium]|nr:HPr family phosphocarrier protein [Candidatus Glassbacteria bacterium]
MPQIELKVQNKLGLHARPAARIVETTKKYKSEITISKNDMQINAKSIMGVMMLAAEKGSVLVVRAEGEDAPEALQAIFELFAQNFDEE